MANIVRGPLYANRREVAPVLQVRAFAVPSLLATVLAVAGQIPLPLGAAHALPLQIIRQPHQLVQNADTSHGTPKTLQADKQLPFFNAPHFAPAPHRPCEWLNPSTATGTPKTLFADKQAPFFVAPPFGPSVKPIAGWLPPDTTQKQPITLQAIIPPPPFVVVPHFAPLRFWWQPADTTCDTPKTLVRDNQAPFMVLQQPLVKSWWQPADSSSGTAKTLTADKQLPFRIPQHTAPDPVRPVTDTTQSAYGPTHPVVVLALPPGIASYVGGPGYTWTLGDTSQESPPVAIQNVQPAPVVVVTPPLQGGARPPWKRRYVRIGNKEFVVNTEADVRYLLQRELSKPQPIVQAKPKGKPQKVVAPAVWEAMPLNPVSVEIALRSRDEEMIAVLKRLIAEHDERDVEFILLTLH